MIHEKIEIQLKNSEFKANLFTYFLDNSPEIDPKRKRPVVLICPGGGYAMTSDREAEALAVKFLAMEMCIRDSRKEGQAPKISDINA